MTKNRILIIGDSYMNAETFRVAFDARGLDADVETVGPQAASTDVSAIREFEGDPAQVARLIAGYEVVALHAAPITADVLDAAAELRLVGCARGGPVNVDIAAAKARGVRVTTTPGKNADAVADLTIGFLVSLLRNVPASLREVDDRVRTGRQLAESTFEGARWFGRELSTTTLGLVGYGNVARLVSQRARALGTRVIAYDPFVDPASVPEIEVVAELNDLFARSEVVSVHARATEDNRGMVGAEQFGAMRQGSLFINTARESLVDEQDLLEALTSGHLGGAALDVNEPDGPWRELVAQSNLVLTPHLAGATYETLQRGAEMLASEVDAFLAGDELRWER
ncbi:NAD(P)-dependent oxidoreductase [Microbacterium halotolerans]|uniref:NAD(P)-dependent oxidoreductase n=1 Tax=Microbacterium halotolerans TaxID=246613 RepID=UPI000E6AD4C7|nr:NAD(P)-dependent oxidoreductase [Microbacterium halotolerans]